MGVIDKLIKVYTKREGDSSFLLFFFLISFSFLLFFSNFVIISFSISHLFFICTFSEFSEFIGLLNEKISLQARSPFRCSFRLRFMISFC